MTLDRVFEPYPYHIEVNWPGVPDTVFDVDESPLKPPAFLRPVDAPLDCVWCFSYFWEHRVDFESLSKWNFHQQLWRVLPWHFEGENYWVLLRRSCGLIFREGNFRVRSSYIPGNDDSGARFKRWKHGPMNQWRWMHLPQQEITGWFEEEIARPEADFHIALRWLQTPRKDRIWRNYQWTGGKWDEYESLLRAIMIVFHQNMTAPESKESELICHFKGSTRSPNLLWFWAKRNREGRRRIPAPDILKHLNTICHAAFLPYRPAINGWRSTNGLGTNVSPTTPALRISPPTEHEKLEAFLRLREWLEGIGEWGNIGPLLPR